MKIIKKVLNLIKRLVTKIYRSAEIKEQLIKTEECGFGILYSYYIKNL